MKTRGPEDLSLRLRGFEIRPRSSDRRRPQHPLHSHKHKQSRLQSVLTAICLNYKQWCQVVEIKTDENRLLSVPRVQPAFNSNIEIGQQTAQKDSKPRRQTATCAAASSRCISDVTRSSSGARRDLRPSEAGRYTSLWYEAVAADEGCCCQSTVTGSLAGLSVTSASPKSPTGCATKHEAG